MHICIWMPIYMNHSINSCSAVHTVEACQRCWERIGHLSPFWGLNSSESVSCVHIATYLGHKWKLVSGHPWSWKSMDCPFFKHGKNMEICQNNIFWKTPRIMLSITYRAIQPSFGLLRAENYFWDLGTNCIEIMAIHFREPAGSSCPTYRSTTGSKKNASKMSWELKNIWPIITVFGPLAISNRPFSY